MIRHEATYNTRSKVPEDDRCRKGHDISNCSCEVEEKEDIANEATCQRGAIQRKTPFRVWEAYGGIFDTWIRRVEIVPPRGHQCCGCGVSCLSFESLDA